MFELVNSTPRNPAVRIICFASEFKTLPLIVECNYLVIDETTGLMADWHWVRGDHSDDNYEYKASDSVPITAEALDVLLEKTDLTVFLCSYAHSWRKKVIDQLGRYYNKFHKYVLFIAVHWSVDQTDHAQKSITSEYQGLSYDGNLVCSSLDSAVIAVRGVAELIMTPSFIGMDFSDVRTVLENNQVLHAAFGCSSGEGRALNAITSALSEVSTPPQSMLVTINVGLDLELDEFSTIFKAVDDAVAPDGVGVVGVVYYLELDKKNCLEVSLISGYTVAEVEDD